MEHFTGYSTLFFFKFRCTRVDHQARDNRVLPLRFDNAIKILWFPILLYILLKCSLTQRLKLNCIYQVIYLTSGDGTLVTRILFYYEIWSCIRFTNHV